MSEGTVILRAVSAAPLWLGAAPDLTKVSGALGALAYLFTLNGFYGFLVFVAAHGAATWLTWRDPDCVHVLRAWAKARKAKAFLRVKGNRYVP